MPLNKRILAAAALFELCELGARAQSPTITSTPLPTSPGSLVSRVVVDNLVLDVGISPTHVYLAGDFNTIGYRCQGLAGLDPTTGELLDGFPQTDGPVRAIISDGQGGWFVGGEFSSIGGVPRSRLARLAQDHSVDLSFNPNVGDTVWDLLLSGGKLYAAGEFTAVNGFTPRNRAAAFNPSTGAVDPSFNPNLNWNARTLAESGGRLYIGGEFTQANGGTPVGYLAAFDPGSGALDLLFSPNLSYHAYDLLAAGGKIFAVGAFTSVNTPPVTRNRAAAFDPASGVVDPTFNPNLSWAGNSLASDGSRVYIGGDFSQVNGGTPVTGLGAFDPLTGVVDPTFIPRPSFNVSRILLDGGRLYAIGSFFTVNGGAVTMYRAAAFSASDGTVVASFDPSAGQNLAGGAIAVGGGSVLIGGDFESMNVRRIPYLAAVRLSDRKIEEQFAPRPNWIVRDALYAEGKLYAGGSFWTVNGGITRNRIAAFDPLTGAVDPDFNPNLSSDVVALESLPGVIYAGGYFVTVGGAVVRNRLAAFYSDTGALLSGFNPDLNQAVHSLKILGSQIFAGGDFTAVNGGTPRSRLASFDINSGLHDADFDADADGRVDDLGVSGGKLVAAGAFDNVNQGSYSRDGLALFDPSTGAVDSSFNASFPGNPSSVELADNWIYANSKAYDNQTASTDSLFNPTLYSISAIRGFSPNLHYGGDFSDVNGLPNQGYAEIVPAYSYTPTLTATPTPTAPAPTPVPSATFEPSPSAAGSLLSRVVANNEVRAITSSSSHVYLGGNYTELGYRSNFLALVGDDAGGMFSRFPETDGRVEAIIPDGTGGWYVGGTFSVIGGVARNRLAHVLPDQSVDPAFNPNVTGTTVYDLLLSGGRLYVGGWFTAVNGGVLRSNIAALNPATGLVVAGFTLNANGYVSVLRLINGKLYLGGSFSQLTGAVTVNRQALAAVNPTTGAVDLPFNPAVGGDVYALADSGTTIYAGGWFWDINAGAVSRANVAAVDRDSGVVIASFDPDTNSPVKDLALVGSWVLLAGDFFSLNGGNSSRPYLAAVDRVTGLLDPAFNAGVNGWVNDVELAGGQLYAGGNFTSAQGGLVKAEHAARLDPLNGSADPFFRPRFDDSVMALSASGEFLAVGGDFHALNFVDRSRLGAVRLSDGVIDPVFDPHVTGGGSGIVDDLKLQNGLLYLSGSFSQLDGGLIRNNLAAVNPSSGNPYLPFNPNVNSRVESIAFSPSGKLYLVGSFLTINGGLTRNYMASVDSDTGVADPLFNPNLGSWAEDVEFYNGLVYAAGNFTSVNGGASSRGRIAAFDPGTGTVDPTFNPNANDFVNDLAFQGGLLYAVGSFTSVNGSVVRNRMAALDPSTGTADAGFNPNIGFWSALDVAPAGTQVYTGGNFQDLNGGVTMPYLAALGSTDGTVDSGFITNLDGGVGELYLGGEGLYVGGLYDRIGNKWHSNFALIRPSAGTEATPTPAFSRTSTRTPTHTRTVTPTPTISATRTISATATFTRTFTRSPTVSSTLTRTPTVSASLTASPTGTWTRTATLSATDSPTHTLTTTVSRTISPTPTISASRTRTATASFTATRTPTPSPSPTASRTETPTPSATPTVSASRTLTPSASASPTASASLTDSPSSTGTRTASPTRTHSGTPTSSSTPSASPTGTPTRTPTRTATVSATVSETPTESATYTVSATITLTSTPVPGLEAVHPFPNPIQVETGTEFITFTNLPLDAEIRVYTAAGKHVRTLQAGGKPELYWDLRNAQGITVAGGPYIWLARTASGEEKIGRLGVIR